MISCLLFAVFLPLSLKAYITISGVQAKPDWTKMFGVYTSEHVDLILLLSCVCITHSKTATKRLRLRGSCNSISGCDATVCARVWDYGMDLFQTLLTTLLLTYLYNKILVLFYQVYESTDEHIFFSAFKHSTVVDSDANGVLKSLHLICLMFTLDLLQWS